ncbi:cytochrome c biogenesis protein [Termitidicoccus mucosus]|uniref:cytochrome c biogenesis protein n=1 Tax=Termitidicoccus mucosus TaxID=1184151 RepID=UPI0008390465
MRALWHSFVDFFVSLRLTVWLLALSIALVFFATLDQVQLGVWGVQQKWFHSFIVIHFVKGVPLPVFPGGYCIGGLLFFNLLAAHARRFRFSWKKSGILLTHFGLLLLLVGEFFTGIMQEDYQLRLDVGQTKNYSEHVRRHELAIIDTTAPDHDRATVFPEKFLARHRDAAPDALPFRVITRAYYPNVALNFRERVPNAPPPPSTHGLGERLVLFPLAETHALDESNIPAAVVELVASSGSLGTWLVSPVLDQLGPQTLEHDGRTWRLALRPERAYKPYSVTLLEFRHDRYPGTDIPKNFSSRVRLHSDAPGAATDREVLIYMNNPLRYDGLTFYQASFANDDRTSILQVVRNPGWLLPYIACVMMGLGLLVQFSISFTHFLKRRPSGTDRNIRAALQRDGARSAIRIPRSEILLPLAVLLLALVAIAAAIRPAKNKTAFDTEGFARLPVLADGRIKPLDTVARSTLLRIQGRQNVKTGDGRRLTPAEWLLDAAFRPDEAARHRVFEITHPDLLALLQLRTDDGDGGKRFSLDQLAPRLDALDAQGRLAQEKEDARRDSYDKAVVALLGNIHAYQQLQYSLALPGHPDFLGQLLRFQEKLPEAVAAARAREAGRPHDNATLQLMAAMQHDLQLMDTNAAFRAIPPNAPGGSAGDWRTAGAALLDTFSTGRLDLFALTCAAMGQTWREQNPEKFNEGVRLYRQNIEPLQPAALSRASIEGAFNHAALFYHSAVLYVVVFLLAALSWLKWPRILARSALFLMMLAWLLTTAGILTRMWLGGYPPITNLYSSALGVAWFAVTLCIALEFIHKNAVASMAGGIIGFCALLIAHHLSLSGDTLEMMRAVLDNNFWLATHVVTITVGYSATFLAGILAILCIFLRFAPPPAGGSSGTDDSPVDGAPRRNPQAHGRDARATQPAKAAPIPQSAFRDPHSLQRMVYGIVCFATLFSLVGTVLGGIWADQSWGRFWGWDPKENGALIIVMWNAIYLHARWGGLAGVRGLMMMAVFGNIVTAWSWFGTNLLEVGLHSYGFTDKGAITLGLFVATQLVIIALALIPARTGNGRQAGGPPGLATK